MKMIPIKAHFVVFLQIADMLSSFTRHKISDLNNSAHCLSGLGDQVKLLLKSDIRQHVEFLQMPCRLFRC